MIIMKYRVMYKSTDYLYLDVEANSLEEAKEIAENTDSGEFVEDGAGDWEYDRTEDKDGNVLKFVDKGNNTYVLAKDQTVTTGVVTEVVTGANGQLVVKGLDKGEYQFKEVTAPDGYSINETNSSATLTITGDKATAEFTADTDMRDTEVGALPETGGIGTTIFTVGGCAIMVAAAALFFMNKKKHEK